MRLLVIIVFILAQLAPLYAGSAWHVKRVGGRDYLPFSDIAKFYELQGDITPVNSFVTVRGRERDLEASIDSRQVIIDGVKHWLGFPMIDIDGEAYVSRIDLAKTLDPVLRPTKIDGLQQIDTVVLDPGHGGKDHGATSAIVHEKDLNLDVCRRIKAMLELKGLNVVMTRDDDTFVPLHERANIANKYENAILISVHFNYSPNGSEAEGIEIFSLSPKGTPGTNDNYLLNQHMAENKGNACDPLNITLATSIQHAVLGTMPRFDRGVKRARFAVLRLSKIPTVLVEGGFLSNGQDTEHAASTYWRASFAEAVTSGVLNYRKLASDRTRPKLAEEYRAPRNTALAFGDIIQAPDDVVEN